MGSTLPAQVSAERSPSSRRRHRRWGPLHPVFFLMSLGVHAVLLGIFVLVVLTPMLERRTRPRPRPMELVVVERPPPEPEPEVEPPEPVFEGQIVEVAPPEVEEVPEESEYLAQADHATEHETKTEKFEINPEVLAPTWSREQAAESEEAIDLNVERKSTGATVGNHRFDPDRDGALAALPSPWERTNKVGPQDPIPSSSRTASLSGAPQNDLLDEEVGDRVDLNTTKYPYASYIERIRRQVNYWWQQNLDNLPSSVRLARDQYTSGVEVILNADGALEHIEVSKASGSPELDDCVVRAFRLAAPFENPPPGLVKPDGRVYLPDFDFTVQLSAARLQYEGVDPRAGVQFPGILKAPR
ncbi:MAG: TonB family protein [Alphaproteobacteria bacterium]|nr:TonB family protein [Alphaproteobacteria bacterium]